MSWPGVHADHAPVTCCSLHAQARRPIDRVRIMHICLYLSSFPIRPLLGDIFGALRDKTVCEGADTLIVRRRDVGAPVMPSTEGA
jgi:hypothetical protein